MSTVADKERIEDALDALLTEVVKRIQLRPSNPGKLTATLIKIRSFDELASLEDAKVSEILDEPVEAA